MDSSSDFPTSSAPVTSGAPPPQPPATHTVDGNPIIYIAAPSSSSALVATTPQEGRPFLWVVKEAEAAAPGVREWLQALEACTSGRGLVVRRWALQLVALAHRVVGGFVTHYGWNSLLEAIVHSVPVVTWPHFSDQFLNERLAMDVLGVGLPVGVTKPVAVLGDEAGHVMRGDLVRAVSALMGEGEAADERRRKVKEYEEKAHRAMEKEGSLYQDLTRLIESFRQSHHFY